MPAPRAQAWYERPGPVFGLLAALLFVGFFFTIAWRTLFYYRDFRSGGTAQLPQFQNRFTPGQLAGAALREGSHDVHSADAPYLGAENAKLTIVEFGDFECPFSREAYPSIRTIAAEHPELIRYEWRDFPLDTLHPHARLAAAASSCANKQGKFWQMHDKLFLNQNSLERADLINNAVEVGLNKEQFTTCLDAGGDVARLQADIAAGTAAGVRGTPTFFINGARIEGAVPYETLKLIAERAGT